MTKNTASGAYPRVEHLKGDLLRLDPASPANTILSWKGFPGANTLACYEKSLFTAVKRFITFSPGANVINLFTAVNYEFS
jgi:hypothetical protein